MNALPLILLLLLAGGGGGGGASNDFETSQFPKKKKQVTPPVVTGPGGTVIDGNKIIEKSDWYNDIQNDVKYYREKLEDVDGMVLAAAVAYGFSAEAIVAYRSIKTLTHLVFPDEGESQIRSRSASRGRKPLVFPSMANENIIRHRRHCGHCASLES